MTGGVATALDQVIGDQVDGEQLVQAALFEPEEVGALDAPSPLSAAITPRVRKAGRPPGSRNRRTEAVAGWLLSQGRHPVLVMMEAYSLTPADLATRIGLTPERREIGPEGVEVPVYDNDVLVELFKLQMRMTEAAAPYLAQKLPQAVQVSAEGAVQVTLAGVSFPARGGLAGGGEAVIQGQSREVMGVILPKSDASSRTDG